MIFDSIWPEEWARGLFAELRTISQDRKVWSRFYRLSGEPPEQLIIDALAREQAGDDVYYGVLPRTEEVGRNEYVPETTPIIWADIDTKKAYPDLSDREYAKQLVLADILSLPPVPQIIVDSGGGYHCYWRLSQLESLEDAQTAMRWVARALRGDSVHDGARVLRLPGTLNRKYDPPVRARYIRINPSAPATRLSDILSQIPPSRERRPANTPYERTEGIPDWLDELIRDGAPQGSRSEQCFRAMLWLIRYGRTREEVHTIFAANPQGIGQKMAEKGLYDGDRWFDLTFTSAEGVA